MYPVPVRPSPCFSNRVADAQHGARRHTRRQERAQSPKNPSFLLYFWHVHVVRRWSGTSSRYRLSPGPLPHMSLYRAVQASSSTSHTTPPPENLPPFRSVARLTPWAVLFCDRTWPPRGRCLPAPFAHYPIIGTYHVRARTHTPSPLSPSASSDRTARPRRWPSLPNTHINKQTT